MAGIIRSTLLTLLLCQLPRLTLSISGSLCPGAKAIIFLDGNTNEPVATHEWPIFSMKVLSQTGKPTSEYRSGVFYTVRIDTSRSFFRSFILIAREATNETVPDPAKRVGEFHAQPSWPDQGVEYRICGGQAKDVVTNLDNRQKSGISIRWSSKDVTKPVQFTFSLIDPATHLWVEFAPASGHLKPQSGPGEPETPDPSEQPTLSLPTGPAKDITEDELLKLLEQIENGKTFDTLVISKVGDSLKIVPVDKASSSELSAAAKQAKTVSPALPTPPAFEASSAAIAAKSTVAATETATAKTTAAIAEASDAAVSTSSPLQAAKISEAANVTANSTLNSATISSVNETTAAPTSTATANSTISTVNETSVAPTVAPTSAVNETSVVSTVATKSAKQSLEANATDSEIVANTTVIPTTASINDTAATRRRKTHKTTTTSKPNSASDEYYDEEVAATTHAPSPPPKITTLSIQQKASITSIGLAKQSNLTTAAAAKQANLTTGAAAKQSNITTAAIAKQANASTSAPKAATTAAVTTRISAAPTTESGSSEELEEEEEEEQPATTTKAAAQKQFSGAPISETTPAGKTTPSLSGSQKPSGQQASKTTGGPSPQSAFTPRSPGTELNVIEGSSGSAGPIEEKVAEAARQATATKTVIVWPPRPENRIVSGEVPNAGRTLPDRRFTQQQSQDYCKLSPCKHGGNCTLLHDQDDYRCDCLPGFAGKDCADADFCIGHQQCRNGARCVSSGQGFHCDCAPGWSGAVCDKFCPTYLCENGGTCIFDDVQIYSCQCPPGWTGQSCRGEADLCASNPCLHDGTCKPKFNGYTCQCARGFVGDNCERPCQDVYKSCERWKSEDRCEANTLTKFFDLNCPVTCGVCSPSERSVRMAVDYPPFPPALAPFHWMIGTWEANIGNQEHYPFDFKTASGYRETISLLVAEVPMFGPPSLNYSTYAVSNDNSYDAQQTSGFLTIKRATPNSKKIAALMTTSNNGANIIEEGSVDPDKTIMKLTGVYTAGLPFVTWRLPKETLREFSLRDPNHLRVRSRFIDMDGQVRDFENVYAKTSGRQFY